jgi:1-acyl-sn-glycerol-3-phosphate acyltransferase
LNQGLGICIFPEGGVPEEHIVLDSFKEGAFRMAIAHKIPIVPITFLDNKKRFSFTLYSGGPGSVRARVHRFFETAKMEEGDKASLRERVREVILTDLLAGNGTVFK